MYLDLVNDIKVTERFYIIDVLLFNSLIRIRQHWTPESSGKNKIYQTDKIKISSIKHELRIMKALLLTVYRNTYIVPNWAIQLFSATQPLTSMCIDIIGNLIKTERRNGYLIIITDPFSKLTETVFMKLFYFKQQRCPDTSLMHGYFIMFHRWNS